MIRYMCVSIGLRLLVKPEFLLVGGGGGREMFLLLNNANQAYSKYCNSRIFIAYLSTLRPPKNG